MISGTESKAKFKKLQRRLNLSLWECTGLLESIWRVCVQNTPRGDIGRLSNEDIAALIEWDRDADELIQALVDYGWLDECADHRLVVHDWAKHAPNFIKGALAKHGQRMIGESEIEQPAKHGARQVAKQDQEQAAKQHARARATYPSLSKPIQAEPSRTECAPGSPSPASAGDEISIPEEHDADLSSGIREEANRILDRFKGLRLALGRGGRPRDDAELVFRVAALTRLSVLPEAVLAGSLEALERKHKSTANPLAFWRSCLIARCTDYEINFHSLIDRLAIPDWANESIDRIVAQLSHGGRAVAASR